MDYRSLTAPCGIDCFNCELFEDNIAPEMDVRELIDAKMRSLFESASF